MGKIHNVMPIFTEEQSQTPLGNQERIGNGGRWHGFFRWKIQDRQVTEGRYTDADNVIRLIFANGTFVPVERVDFHFAAPERPGSS